MRRALAYLREAVPHGVVKQASVSDLRARLRAYLAAVREGEEVVVYHRGTPIARVVPWEDPPDDFTVEESTRRLPRLSELPRIHLLGPVDVVQLLRESRDQR